MSLRVDCIYSCFDCCPKKNLVHLNQIDAKKEQLADAKRELKSAKADAKVRRDEKSKK